MRRAVMRAAVRAAVIAGAISGGALSASGQRLTVLEGAGAVETGGQLRLVREAVSAGRVEEARQRWESLSGGGAERMVAGEAGVLRAMGAVVEEWPAEVRAALRGDGSGARGAWESARARMDADPVELARLARRFPAGGEAVAELLAEAARRTVARGDALSAGQLIARAKAAGWSGTVPGEGGAGFVVRTGGVVAEYWWFRKTPDRLGGTRVMGTSAGGVTFVGSQSHVVALREGRAGASGGSGGGGVGGVAGGGVAGVAWVWPGVPLGRMPDEAPDRLSFQAFVPAVICGADGTPLVVYARTVGERGGVLRALRASDGRELWSSEGRGETAGLHVASSPAVAGRYVYVTAADTSVVGGRGPMTAGLYLVALDAMTGEQLFRSRLGDLAELPMAGRQRRKDAVRPPGLWDGQTAPLVHGEAVYVAPGGGMIKVDRLDGTVLAVARYDAGAFVAKEGSGPVEQPMSRWNDTPVAVGGVVVVAARDTEEVRGWDTETLRPRWSASRMGAWSMVGGGRGEVVLQSGDGLVGLSGETGERRWALEGKSVAAFVGPAVMAGEVVVVPTEAGLRAAAVRGAGGGGEVGWLAEVPVRVSEMRPWLGGEPLGLLRATDVLTALAGPSAALEVPIAPGGERPRPGTPARPRPNR